MKKRTIAIISYITLVGWLIAYFNYNKGKKHSLEKYHLEQSLGLGITVSILNIILGFAYTIDSFFFIPLAINNFLFLIISIAGIISSYYSVRLPLPLIGSYFENKFKFLMN
ncbi:hypothetical protein GCM10011508_20600 [Flavobacterium lutivivi]|nr:hypothetical protein GCM10011508_20600 [Flavobacterium lutivivi]